MLIDPINVMDFLSSYTSLFERPTMRNFCHAILTLKNSQIQVVNRLANRGITKNVKPLGKILQEARIFIKGRKRRLIEKLCELRGNATDG